MQCKNHPAVAAIDRCAGCAESFCGDCLVEIQGQKYCASCKTMTVKAPPPPVVEEASIPCKEAGEALTYALVGILCFGIILEPIALVKASKAAKMMEANPRLTGSGKVLAARIIAGIVLTLNVLYFVGLAVGSGRR